MKVSEVWDHYVQTTLSKTVDPKNNERFWRNLKWFADLDANALTPKEVEQYIQHRGDVSGATLNRELGLLRAALKQADRERLIDRAPFIPSLAKSPPRMYALNRDESAKLLAAADDMGWRERVYTRLLLGTAARMGAVLDITWGKVDWSAKIVDLRSTSHLAGRMKGRAIVPFNDTLEEGLKIAKKHRDGPYVLHRDGRQLGTAKHIMRRVAHAAGLERVSSHVLRHTVASILLQDGEDILPVSRLLGHSSTVVTETIYFQHSQEWLRNTSKRLKF